MAKVLCVLYDDPVNGYPKSYARDDLPKLERYPGGQTLPTPRQIDFKPGELLGSVSGELGLRKFLEGLGHTLVVTVRQGRPATRSFERELPDAEIVISQPFWPAYLTAERIAKAPKLKLAITAGIGSDHVDLQAAIDRGITVAEVTYCNSISVSEHVVMMILSLVRNYIPSYQWVVKRRLEHRRLRRALLRRRRHGGRHGRRRPHRPRGAAPAEAVRREAALHRPPSPVRRRSRRSWALTFHADVESMVRVCDVVTINAPLHPETEHLFNDTLIAKMKRGAYLVNTARGKICDRDAIARALESGQLAGYAGDVWFPQPAPKDHPWRTMPHHGMTPHISGIEPVGAGALRRRHARDPRMLVRRAADPRGVPDRRRRQARRHRRAFLQRRQRDRAARRSGTLPNVELACRGSD